MLVAGDMKLSYLLSRKVLSIDLYKFLTICKVESLQNAILLLDSDALPKVHRKELEELKCRIEESRKAFNDFTIKDLYLRNHISKRLCNCLQELGFANIDQVIHYINSNGGNSEILLKQRRFGKKCLVELNEVISFQNSFNNSWTKNKEETYIIQNSKEDDYKITISTTIESIFHESNLISRRTYNCLCAMNFITVSDIIDYIKEVGSIYRFLSIRNFGKKSLDELQDLLDWIEDNTLQTFQDIPTEIEPVTSSLDKFLSQYEELIKNDNCRLSIELYYTNCKSRLSARTVHVLEENFKSVTEIVCLYFTGFNMLDLKNCGKKTYNELLPFVVNLYNYISSLFVLDWENIEVALLENQYPFLSENEIEFIINFKKIKLHLPMFYILYHYLIRTNARFEKLFCRYYGIGCPPEGLKDISASMNLSFERCRQLLRKQDLKDSSLINSNDWSNYGFLDEILLYNSCGYEYILADEGLGQLPILTFIGLCSLVKGIKVCKIGKANQKEYYVSEKLYDCFDLKNCIKDIDATLNKRCTEDINLPLSVFIDSYWQKEPTFNASEVAGIITSILKDDYGIDIGEDKVIHISQNAIDRSEEIYKIIEEYGTPMHIKLIREVLISRYPELYDLSIEQLRGYALKHNHIKALGKSSTYTIDKWKLYTGTIRDLLFDILSEEEEPMNIEKLYEEVSVIYPNTSIKSITSSMLSDDLQRFVRFVGSYYGIASKIYDDEFIVWDAEAYSRKTFDERTKELEAFLKSHRHLPRYDKDNEDEAALCRWYKRVTADDAPISSEQQIKLSDLLSRNADFLVTATEYSFYRYCEEFKAFIEDNMNFPTLETDSAKYGWFMKNKKIYKDFEDRRKVYFGDLIDFLYIYGFEV